MSRPMVTNQQLSEPTARILGGMAIAGTYQRVAIPLSARTW
jgi:hypothetical protein